MFKFKINIFLQIKPTSHEFFASDAAYMISYILWTLAALLLVGSLIYYRKKVKKINTGSFAGSHDSTSPTNSNVSELVPDTAPDIDNDVDIDSQKDIAETAKANSDLSNNKSTLAKVEIIEKTDTKIVIEGKRENISDFNLADTSIIGPLILDVLPEKEEQSLPKYIGYNPINIWEQTEPLNYPYVIMPKVGSVIKFPRKGRTGRKGYKEDDFLKHISIHFQKNFKIYNDRFILVKGSARPFEPDISLIDETNGINLFIDIEIDEPYEGINNISARKAMHYQHVDINRNMALKSRGWITIRFAEIQVHEHPDSCCMFIADVLRSINPEYVVPMVLDSVLTISPIAQWTKQQAEIWSKERYRERYLGIESFGRIPETVQIGNIEETELGELIEEEVIDDSPKTAPLDPIIIVTGINPLYDLIKLAITSGQYISFSYEGKPTIVRPIKLNENCISGYCYVKNEEKKFFLDKTTNHKIKDNPFTLEAKGPNIGIDKIRDIVNTAIKYDKYIRMKYTRIAWTNILFDKETGELITDRREAEESVRTINDVGLTIDKLTIENIRRYNLNYDYITAYCNKREDQRTFRFDRIGEIAILDI